MTRTPTYGFLLVAIGILLGLASWTAGLPRVHAAAPDAAPELQLRYTDQFIAVWTDAGSGGTHSATFYKPVVPAGYLPLAHYGAGSNDAPPAYSLVAKALTPGALAKPTDFTQIWTDAGSGSDADGSFWRPVPPDGYVCLSDVVQAGYSKPALDTVYCLRADLTVAGQTEGYIWNDVSTGANTEVTLWHVMPKEELGGIGLNAFVGVPYYGELDPNDRSLYTIKASAVPKLNLAAGVLEPLISEHGPRLVLHPDEPYLPDDPSAILDKFSEVCSGLVSGEQDDYSSLEDLRAYGFDHQICFETSAATLLADTAALENTTYLGDPKFRIWLSTDSRTKFGNLDRAKAFVRVKPGDQIFLEVQFWIYYPFNGAGKIRLDIPNVQTEHLGLDPVGRHYGDWESVRVRFAKDAFGDDGLKLAQVVVSRHGDEFIYTTTNPQLEMYDGKHPIIYSARDSHAHYATVGEQYYERVNDGSVIVDLKDLTATSARTLDLFEPEEYQIVSSEWPTVVAVAPDWLHFKYRWGQFERLAKAISYNYHFGTYTYLYAEIGNGPTGPAEKSIWPYINDSTPPVITPTVVGTLGQNPWYVSNVNVTWTVDDPESEATKVGCEPAVQSRDTTGYLYYCLATSAGGSSYKSASVRVDKTAPFISSKLLPPPNIHGWNNTAVTVQFECSDATSGVAYCSPDATYDGSYFDTYGWTSFSMGGTARDKAGHSASATTPPIRIDLEAPTAALASPQARNYGNNTVLSFNWTAADELSGMLSEVALLDATPMTNGQTVSAAGLALGNHTASLAVTDKAGNVTRRSVDFTIVNGSGDNADPVFTSLPETYFNFQQIYTYSIETADANPADTRTITALTVPNWLTLTDAGNGTAKLQGTAGNSDVGKHEIVLKVEDNAGGSSTQRFTLEITGFVLFETNYAPATVDDSATVDFGSLQNGIDVLANDSDPNDDPLAIVAVSQPAKGTTAYSDGEVLYWPEPGVSGTDIFTYTVGEVDTNERFTATATVTVTILDGPDNRAPSAAADGADVDYGSQKNNIDVLANDSDPDGDPLVLTDVGAAAHGVAYIFGAVARYAPDPGYSGPDSFTYAIGDGRGGTQTATVTVNVAADPNADINQAPLPVDDSIQVTAGSTGNIIDVLANDGDPDGDALSITGFSQPANGTAMASDGTIVYTPTLDFVGSDSIIYGVRDGQGGSAAAKVAMDVIADDTPQNQAPTAVDDQASTTSGSAVTINVTGNDGDADGDTLTIAITAQPANGTATVSNGQIVYTPNAGFTGSDSLTYAVQDGKGGSAMATVTVTVNAPGDAKQEIYLPLVSR